jgi:hypothetical protein
MRQKTDPFYQALKFSARMNMVASVFSGLSALTLSVKLIRFSA